MAQLRAPWEAAERRKAKSGWPWEVGGGQVELRFAPGFAEDAAAWWFHATQPQETGAYGSLFVRFRAGGIEEMVHHLATWGSAVTVIKPDGLRERLLSFALETSAQHQAPSV